MIRTRFAPSPTGFMHLGNLRTALYTYLIAKKHKGTFILRIEDTDQARYVEGAVDVIYNTLKECGLNWDEGPIFQSERKDVYKEYAAQLVEKGHAYHSEGAIWQKTPTTGSTTFKDEIYGEITVENKEIEDQVLIKSDGMPTYNFANVIDDHEMNITHVARGNEYLSSTPKYNLLYEAFGWEIPTYVHLPPIMRDATHKLSKRDGDAYFDDFKEKGYLTEAIINYIALLGWSPKGENEIFTLSELEQAFEISGISKSPAIFDEAKMRAINAEHIRRLSPEQFMELAKPHIGEFDINYNVLCTALQPRTEILSDITPQVDFLEQVCDYDNDLFNNKKMKTSPETAKEALEAALTCLNNSNFDRDSIYNSFKELSEKHERKIGWYLYPLQVALTGKPAAPGGGLDICIMFGKDQSVKRIKEAIEKL